MNWFEMMVAGFVIGSLFRLNTQFKNITKHLYDIDKLIVDLTKELRKEKL